jgi:phospho-N-acetylmuramoyl-pentapeptide-transferase
VRAVLFASVIALVCSLLGTPLVIRLFVKRGYGQYIREDLNETGSHKSKRGTPTMGGTVIVLATIAGYFLTKLATMRGATASAVLVLFLMTGLGVVGFLDDFIKIRNERNLGLRARAKLVGQLAVSITFAVLAVNFHDVNGLTPASTHVSFLRDTAFSLGPIVFVVWAYVIISGTSNAVNLSDGLDGLATGASAMVAVAFVVIGVWQHGESCSIVHVNGCYAVRDPLDLAVVAAALMGACFGFLWWNANPARIILGDTGALALGGAFAGLAICSRTELLLLLLGGMFAIETLSVIIQVTSFKTTGRRVFRITPIHHHFEQLGWAEVTIVIRFWIIAGMFVAFGLGIFYAGWVTGS